MTTTRVRLREGRQPLDTLHRLRSTSCRSDGQNILRSAPLTELIPSTEPECEALRLVLDYPEF